MANSYEQDPGMNRGLILLGICLLVLLGFFFWYNNRSARYQVATTSTEERGGLLSRLFNPGAQETSTTPIADKDGDGLSDSDETAAGTDQSKIDTDGDGLSDREEVVVYKTNPRAADSDSDGMSDGEEITSRRDPRDPNPAAVWPPRPTNLTL